MAINYYELTLVGTHVNNTLKLPVGMTDQPLQRVVLSEGNYTTASIIAVDLCGQRSAPSELILTNTTRDSVSNSDTQKSRVVAIGTGLGVTLSVVTIVMVA